MKDEDIIFGLGKINYSGENQGAHNLSISTMKFYMYSDCWTNARTTDNWQTYSESEDDLESMGTITMMEQPQPISAYVPLTIETCGMESDDEFSYLSDLSTVEDTGRSLDKACNKRKTSECLEVQKNKPEFQKVGKKQKRVDNDEVVYLKTVPPPHLVIDLTMIED